MSIAAFGVSSMAWPPEALDEALGLVASLGCDAVEIAPHGTFGGWSGLDDAAERLLGRLQAHGLRCAALQGIVFGVEDVALFGSEAERTRLLQHLERVAGLAGRLGAAACVFGAPRLRDPGSTPVAEAWRSAVATLREIGPAFAAHDSALAFEANARAYKCRFVTTTAQAVELVRAVATAGIALQIDTGTLLLEDEPLEVLAAAAPLAAHAHVSEPQLNPPALAGHGPIAAALRASGYAESLSIEMRLTEPWQATITAAVGFVRRTYL